MNKAPLVRTRAQAANSNRRIALDHNLADRLERVGVRAYKSAAPEHYVDLATNGAFTEPRGRPLINSALFGSQYILEVMRLRRELISYERQHGRTDNIVSITIRPRRDLRDPATGELLLDSRGNAPVRNLRRAHTLTRTEIQGALEYMQSDGCQWLCPFVVGRHWDPLDGGAVFDIHAHVTAQIDLNHLSAVVEYLSGKFGGDRVWFSWVEEPGIRRDLVATACYPVAKLANRGYSDVADEYLREFFEQTTRLRRFDIVGPLRGARPKKIKAASTGLAAELAAIAARSDKLLDAMSADAILTPVDEIGTTASAEVEKAIGPMVSPPESSDSGTKVRTDAGDTVVGRAPRLICYQFAYIGQTLRWVARVADYAGWNDLASRYDLRRDIAYAEELAAQAEHLLYLDPVTPESSAEGHAVLESLMDHETLSQWDRQPGTDKVSKRGCSTTEPQSHQPLGGKSQPEPVLEPASKPERLTTEPQVLTPESTSTPRSQESGSHVGEMMTVELKVEGGSGSATASVKIALSPSLFAHRAINPPPPAPM